MNSDYQRTKETERKPVSRSFADVSKDMEEPVCSSLYPARGQQILPPLTALECTGKLYLVNKTK